MAVPARAAALHGLRMSGVDRIIFGDRATENLRDELTIQLIQSSRHLFDISWQTVLPSLMRQGRLYSR